MAMNRYIGVATLLLIATSLTWVGVATITSGWTPISTAYANDEYLVDSDVGSGCFQSAPRSFDDTRGTPVLTWRDATAKFRCLQARPPNHQRRRTEVDVSRFGAVPERGVFRIGMCGVSSA